MFPANDPCYFQKFKTVRCFNFTQRKKRPLKQNKAKQNINTEETAGSLSTTMRFVFCFCFYLFLMAASAEKVSNIRTGDFQVDQH